MTFQHLAWASIACLAGLPALAADDSSIDEIVVAGSWNGEAGNMAPTFHVIDREAIEELAPVDVQSLLATLPGVYMAASSNGALTSMSLRGGEANFTVVMIDGIQVNDPTNSRGGLFNVGLLDPSMVERVELAHGGQGALYGSDALSGAINIVTRRPGEAIGGFTRLELGEAGRRKAYARFDLPLSGTTSLGLQGGAQSRDAASDGSEEDQKHVGARLVHTQGTLTLDAGLNYHLADYIRLPADSGGPLYAANSETETADESQLVGSLQARYVMADTVFRMVAGYSQFKQEADTPAVLPGATDGLPAMVTDTDFSRTELTVVLEKPLSAALVLQVGAGYEREDGTSNSLLDFGFMVPAGFSLVRETAAAFADARWQVVEGLELQGAVRYDGFKDQPDQVTGNAGFRWSGLPWGGVLTARWSEGFKLPSFYALAHPLVGNPQLTAERSDGFEIAARWPIQGGGELNVALFQTDYSGLVEFDPDAFRVVNLSDVSAKGFDLSVLVPISTQLELGGHVSYVNTEIEGQPDRALQQRPEWTGAASVQYRPTDELALTARWSYVGQRFDFSVPTGAQPLERYNSLDIVATMHWSDGVEVRLAADNILGEGYQPVLGYQAKSRIRASIGIVW